MIKIRMIVITGIILLLATNNAFALFDGKYKEAQKKLDEMTVFYEKLGKEKQELSVKYETAAKENEALKQDRDNLITQAKALMIDKGKFKETEETVTKLESEKSARTEELNKAREETATLQAQIKELQAKEAEITEERDRFKTAYEKSGKDALIKKLQKDITDLQSVKNKIGVNLAKNEKNLKELTAQKSKLAAEKEKLSQELKQYKTNYAEAIKKNKAFEQDVKNMPQRFSELARQNKKLIKDTAQMHYNMGVFYTKNKEYSRATSEFEKAVEINPDDAAAHFNLGYIYAEYMVDRAKAVDNFRHYLRLAKKGDKDVEWVKKYILTWQTYGGKEPMQ